MLCQRRKIRQQRIDSFLVSCSNDATRHAAPQSTSPSLARVRSGSKQRQTTIPALRGVVVLEDMWRYRQELLAADTECQRLLDIFQILSTKLPPREVLAATGVARILGVMRRKHLNEQVREAADVIYRDWKTHFRELLSRVKQDVACDTVTEERRLISRRHLASALGGVPINSQLPVAIERCLFFENGHLLDRVYRRTAIHVIKRLRVDEKLRQEVCSGHVAPAQLVRDHRKS